MPKRREPIDRLQSEVQELIDELWQVPRFSGLRRGYRPQVDVLRIDDPDEFQVVIELPGIEPDDVKLYADDRTLVVSGERRREHRGRYFHMEIDHGQFQRRIQFPEPIDPSEARAEYARGMLTITLPVAAREAAGARVVIHVGRSS